MKDPAFYKANPWYRKDDISFLCAYDTETDEETVLWETDSLVEAPNWSQDGEALYCNRNGRIVRFRLADGVAEEIPSDYADACNNDHVLSPDGERIAVSHQTREDGASRIYTLPIGGGVPRLITPLAPSYLHGWSPDGRTLCYCAERGGEFDVYSIPAEGGCETRLTDAPGLNDGPEYSPDGKHIWFCSVRSGLMQAWRMRADGSEQTQITDDPDWNLWFPHISPDGKKVVTLAYSREDVAPHEHVPHKRVELRLMDPDGGNMRVLKRLFGGQGTINVNSWAPDSRRFAYVRYAIPGIDEKEL
ncbi:MAG: PD40 domain-containing protein [Clostridia bacterium]|nr:PD40 domain-containing protein [Clostridia bacterium]